LAHALADSHCHLQLLREGQKVEELISRARAAGVAKILVPGTTLEDSARAVALAEGHDGVYAAVGVHPHEAKDFDPGRDASALEAMLESPRVVAIGEIGLDFHYDHSPRPIQMRALRAQMEIAAAHGLPVLLHNRQSGDALMAMLEELGARDRAGVLHSFSESEEFGRRAMSLGYRISFSGMLTFRAADNIRAAAEGLPLEALLVETDTPYLAPVPHRGTPCEPAYVVETARKLAEVKGVAADVVARRTTANFDSLFLSS
jgi:TatD DNase family protein